MPVEAPAKNHEGNHTTDQPPVSIVKGAPVYKCDTCTRLFTPQEGT